MYEGVVASHRKAVKTTGELDPITEDMLIGQCAKLELFRWFMRAHLEDDSGTLGNAGAVTETSAAKKAK